MYRSKEKPDIPNAAAQRFRRLIVNLGLAICRGARSRHTYRSKERPDIPNVDLESGTWQNDLEHGYGRWGGMEGGLQPLGFNFLLMCQ